MSSFAGAAAAAEAMRATVSATLTNAVSLKSAVFFILCYGVPKGASGAPATLKSWRPDFGWKKARGESFQKKITMNRGTAEIKAKGEFKFRDFEERSHVDTAQWSYNVIERTWAVNEDDLELNVDSDAKLVDLRQVSRESASEAVMAALVQVPHYGDATGHNGGLTMFSPTNVAASTSYAGIALDATDDDSNYIWKPGAHDYGADTLAADWIKILRSLVSAAKLSQKAGGRGILRPDFGFADPTAIAKIVEFYQDNASLTVRGGDLPRNMNLFEKGFDNFVSEGVVIVEEDQFGGSTGYIDGAAAEEVMVGNSKAMNMAVVSSRQEGLIRALPDIKGNALVRGELGVFKAGPFAFWAIPNRFALAHT